MAIICAAILGITNYRENKRRDAVYGIPDPVQLGLAKATDPSEKAKYGLEHLTDLEVMSLGDKCTCMPPYISSGRLTIQVNRSGVPILLVISRSARCITSDQGRKSSRQSDPGWNVK